LPRRSLRRRCGRQATDIRNIRRRGALGLRAGHGRHDRPFVLAVHSHQAIDRSHVRYPQPAIKVSVTLADLNAPRSLQPVCSKTSVSHTFGGENAHEKNSSRSLLHSCWRNFRPCAADDGQAVRGLGRLFLQQGRGDCLLPTSKQPASVDHGSNFFVIGRAPGAGYEPQAIMGYELKPGSRAKVAIGDKTFTMFTRASPPGCLKNRASMTSSAPYAPAAT